MLKRDKDKISPYMLVWMDHGAIINNGGVTTPPPQKTVPVLEKILRTGWDDFGGGEWQTRRGFPRIDGFFGTVTLQAFQWYASHPPKFFCWGENRKKQDFSKLNQSISRKLVWNYSHWYRAWIWPVTLSGASPFWRKRKKYIFVPVFTQNFERKGCEENDGGYI